MGTPPGRTSKSSPAAATRISPPDRVPGTKPAEASRRTPLGREQEEERPAGIPRSTPPARKRERPSSPPPPRAGDEGAATAATAQTAPENVVPVVELPLSEEYGESEDIDPAAVDSVAARIVEFVTASEGVLGAEMSEGPGHGASYAIVRSGIPFNFAHVEREEDDW